MDQILLNTEATPKLGELIPPALSDRAQEVKRNHYNNMLKLVEFAKKRRHYRIDNGAVMAWYPTADVTVQEHPETGRETASFGKSKNIFQNARGIITEFMLLAGEIAATFLSERHVPVFYQSQPLVKRSYLFVVS
jgi:exoribonuclease R